MNWSRISWNVTVFINYVFFPPPLYMDGLACCWSKQKVCWSIHIIVYVTYWYAHFYNWVFVKRHGHGGTPSFRLFAMKYEAAVTGSVWVCSCACVCVCTVVQLLWPAWSPCCIPKWEGIESRTVSSSSYLDEWVFLLSRYWINNSQNNILPNSDATLSLCSLYSQWWIFATKVLAHWLITKYLYQ